MKYIYIITFFFITSCSLLLGQPAEKLVRIQITPNHDNFLYKEGESVKFDIAVFSHDVPVKDIEISYVISEDMINPHKKGKLVLKNGVGKIDAGTMNKPGFLRCEVNLKYNNNNYRNYSTVGFSTEKISPTTTLPEDFLEFWEKEKEKLSRMPMDAHMTLVPERCTNKVNVYHVSLQNNERGSRVYGMLTMPKKEGKYPVMLKVPGAGIRPYGGDVYNAGKGIIIFEIGIHGIPVNMPREVYSDLNAGALRDYHSINLNDKDKYYYKRVYLGCVRAIDFLVSLPEFDGKNVITYGGSQGGALSIVTAGLDKRVTGLVAFYPALCDLTGYLHNRAGGWPHMFKDKRNNTSEKINTIRYYDVVNFARQLKIPGFYTYGYNDTACPPTTVFSAMNVIDAPKEILIEESTGHYTYPEQVNASWKWVENLLGL